MAAGWLAAGRAEPECGAGVETGQALSALAEDLDGFCFAGSANAATSCVASFRSAGEILYSPSEMGGDQPANLSVRVADIVPLSI